MNNETTHNEVVKLYEMRLDDVQLAIIEQALLCQHTSVVEMLLYEHNDDEGLEKERNDVKYILSKINEITRNNMLTTEHNLGNMFYIRETTLPEPFDKYDV